MAQNALLTETQREFLRTSDEERQEKYTKQQRSYHRQNIHERLRAGLPDFSLILRNVPPEQIQQALEIRETGEAGDPGDLRLEIGAADAIGVIHLAFRHRDLDKSEGDFVAGRVKKGIGQALNRLGKSVRNMDVSIQIELGRELDAFTDMESDELVEFSERELQQALGEERITSEQFIAAMEQKGLTRDGGRQAGEH